MAPSGARTVSLYGLSRTDGVKEQVGFEVVFVASRFLIIPDQIGTSLVMPVDSLAARPSDATSSPSPRHHVAEVRRRNYPMRQRDQLAITSRRAHSMALAMILRRSVVEKDGIGSFAPPWK